MVDSTIINLVPTFKYLIQFSAFVLAILFVLRLAVLSSDYSVSCPAVDFECLFFVGSIGRSLTFLCLRHWLPSLLRCSY